MLANRFFMFMLEKETPVHAPTDANVYDTRNTEAMSCNSGTLSKCEQAAAHAASAASRPADTRVAARA